MKKGGTNMQGSIDDIEALMNWLDRIGVLDSGNKDLLEDAIFALKSGNDYRAEDRIKTAARNYENDGNRDAAAACERLL